jgi:hypothetical protein
MSLSWRQTLGKVLASSNVPWLAAAFVAALLLTFVVLGVDGAGILGTRQALLVTARFSFLLFWFAYVGGALHALFGSVFLPLKRHTKAFGLAFASAQLVHLGLVAWFCYVGGVPTVDTFIVFGVAALLLYLMAFCSLERFQRSLPPILRRLLFFVGLNYIAIAFSVDFFNSPLQGRTGHIISYLPFAVLSVAALLLRLLAFLLSLLRHRDVSQPALKGHT